MHNQLLLCNNMFSQSSDSNCGVNQESGSICSGVKISNFLWIVSSASVFSFEFCVKLLVFEFHVDSLAALNLVSI